MDLLNAPSYKVKEWMQITFYRVEVMNSIN